MELISSAALEWEIDLVADPVRRIHALNFPARAAEFVTAVKNIEGRARYFLESSHKLRDGPKILNYYRA